MQSRRVFLGSAAGLGAGLAGYSLNQFVPAVTAQQREADPLMRELHRQLRLAMPRLLEADGAAARQAAVTLRIYAATQAGARTVVRQAVQARGRAALLQAGFNHDEMERVAAELAFPVSLLPPHVGADPALRAQALDLLQNEGLDTFMRQTADMIDDIAPSWDERAAAVRRVALQCPNCDFACAFVPQAEQMMTIACAAATFFPPAAEVCMAACATYMSTLAVCMACQIAVGC